jgi:transposase
LMYHAFGVREGYEYRCTKYVEGRVEFHLDAVLDKTTCPQCGSAEFWRRGSRHRRIASLPIGPKPVVLVAEVPKCECRGCGHTFEVSPPLPVPTPATAAPWPVSSVS